MKDPHLLSDTWNQSILKTDRVLAGPETIKKFKRKAREPKRIFRSPDSATVHSSGAMSPIDMRDNTSPLHRQLLVSQEVAATTSELSARAEDRASLSQSDALHMRTGLVHSMSSKVSQLSSSAFTNVEIPHWPTAISQPLSSRLKVGLRSSFPLSSLSSSHQDLCLQPVSQASFMSQCEEEVEHTVQSPQESPPSVRGMAEGGSHHPEVKAIQQTRRLLANARERTRVHTISAAFEALRKQVPCYSYGQKLSKLAILRIACNYILSLAQLAELDYSSEQNNLSFSHCVEQCTRTLQAEGRSKKKKVGRMLENV